MNKTNAVRLIIFVIAAGIHGVLIFFAALPVNTAIKGEEPPARVMKLVDIREDIPPPPPPPPPPPERPPVISENNALESPAEIVIETGDFPGEVSTEVLEAVPGEWVTVQEIPPASAGEAGPPPEIEYLPMHSLSELPSFSEREIRNALVHPPIALRSKIEGIVYLELFVDKQGAVRRVTVLREEPAGRGFGEAAVKAFTGLKGKPARANGKDVAARYRYPVRFTVR